MKKYTAILMLMLLPGLAWGQNKVMSSAPSDDSVQVKQLEANIDFLMRELDILHKKVLALYPLFTDVAACSALGQVYSPGAAGFGSKCVPLSGPPFVSEIKVTTATRVGNMVAYGSTASDRIQGFINANGCPTSSGWHACTDDEVIFALDNRVTGATNLDTFINLTNGYWVRSLVPYRFYPGETPASGAVTSYNCEAWSNGGASLTVIGTIFSADPNMPRFMGGSCGTARGVLCCR